MTTARWPSSSRMGFTLVELLVVIAIIGILTAIAVPAVQMARAAAARTSCQNNMKEIARATIAYESSKRKYPSSFSTVQIGANVQTMPWCVDLLPELDQQLLYEQIQSTGLIAGADLGYIKSLNCPSNPTATRRGTEISYGANMGYPDQTAGGGALDVFGTGIFYDRSVRGMAAGGAIEMTAVKVRDGLAQTVLFGENANMPASGVFWNFSNNVTAATSSSGTCVYTSGDPTSGHQEFAFGIVWFESQPFGDYFGSNKNVAFQSQANPWVLARPSSWHGESFLMAFADGRVETLNNEVGYDVYCRLMTADGSRASTGLANTFSVNGAIGVGVVDQAMFAD